jgi:hypothetical protein
MHLNILFAVLGKLLRRLLYELYIPESHGTKGAHLQLDVTYIGYYIKSRDTLACSGFCHASVSY